MRRNKAKFIEDLACGATSEAILSSNPPESAYRRGCVEDRHKPGRSIMKMSEEDREFIKTLKSEDFNHRRVL